MWSRGWLQLLQLLNSYYFAHLKIYPKGIFQCYHAWKNYKYLHNVTWSTLIWQWHSYTILVFIVCLFRTHTNFDRLLYLWPKIISWQKFNKYARIQFKVLLDLNDPLNELPHAIYNHFFIHRPFFYDIWPVMNDHRLVSLQQKPNILAYTNDQTTNWWIRPWDSDVCSPKANQLPIIAHHLEYQCFVIVLELDDKLPTNYCSGSYSH